MNVILSQYHVTVISRSQHEHSYDVEAASADEAIDKVLEDIAYDVDRIHLDGEVIYL